MRWEIFRVIYKLYYTYEYKKIAKKIFVFNKVIKMDKICDSNILQGIDLLIKWLTETDVLNKSDKFDYSLNNGYSFRKKRYNFVYNEITGYSISVFIYLFNRLKEDNYLLYAQKVAAYLLSIQEKNQSLEVYGSVVQGFRLPKFEKSEFYYTFDNFIIIQGLCDLYSVDKNPRYLESAELIADWIIDKMLKNTGSYYARYNSKKESKDWITKKFSGDNGVLHAKSAIAFLKLYNFTHNSKYKEIAEKTLNWALSLQDNDGGFWANEKKEYLFSHAQCYICEGLVYTYYQLRKTCYLEALENALEFFRIKLNKDGSLYHIYKDKKLWRKIVLGVCPYKATDVTSQYIRLVILLSYIKQDETILKHYRIADSIDFILDNQVINSCDKNELNGLYHKICDRFGFKIISPIMSTWCVQFSIQALFEYRYYNIENNEWFRSFIQMLY